MKTIEIKSITLTIGSQKIELSVDEAKKLQQELDKLMGERQTVYYPTTIPYTTDYPPTITFTTGTQFPITCQSTTPSQG